MTTELYSNRSNGERISILISKVFFVHFSPLENVVGRVDGKSFLFQLFIVSNIKICNNFKFIHSFIAGKRPHRKPDTQILGDYGVEEWRDGGK